MMEPELDPRPLQRLGSNHFGTEVPLQDPGPPAHGNQGEAQVFGGGGEKLTIVRSGPELDAL